MESYKYCDMNGLLCLSKNVDTLYNGKKNHCKCTFACMNTVYELEKLQHVENPEDDHVHIGLISWPMVKYKKEVLFGWVDLLVSFGGIAGLFLGFSILSGVEMIYYFTMRACCMVYRNEDELDDLQVEYDKIEKPPMDLSLVPTFLRSKEFDTYLPSGSRISPMRVKEAICVSNEIAPNLTKGALLHNH